jgi:acyl-CoA thioesterase I
VRPEEKNMETINLNSFLKREEPVTWLFAGDSITQGARHTRGWRDYTQLFKERLGELTRNRDVVINTGVGGANIKLLKGSGLEDRVLRFNPDVVFIMFGTNDAVLGKKWLQSFIDDYVEVIHRLQAAKIGHIIMQTTIPMFPANVESVIESFNIKDKELKEAKLHGFRQREKYMVDYAEATGQTAERLKTDLIDHYKIWSDPICHGQLMDGGFHPNEYGHRMIAHTIFKACEMWDDTRWTCRLFVPTD